MTKKDKIEAITDGKKDAEKASTAIVATSSAVGTGVWAAAKSLAKKGVGKIVETTTTVAKVPAAAISTIGATTTAVIAGSAALVIAGFCYNQFYILPLRNKQENLVEVYKDIYKKVFEAVIHHRWIDNNVLITAAPTDTSCYKGYSGFNNISGIKYDKSQEVKEQYLICS